MAWRRRIRPCGGSWQRHGLGLACCLLAAWPVPVQGTEELSGRLSLSGSARERRSADPRAAVVYFEPREKISVEVPREPFAVTTVRKQFLPRVLAVPVGSRVRFPNEDPILHNVFSVSGRNRFDLGLYKRDSGKEVTFRHPGVVRIFCNVHHAMVAYVAVLETPFYATPGRDGSFTLQGLPPGPGKLTVWHERAEPWERQLDPSRTGPLEVSLEITKPAVPKHLNKLGKRYVRRREDAY